MINANEFYEECLENQRKNVEKKINEAKTSGDPLVRLEFLLYPKVQEELEKNGWIVKRYNSPDNGFPCHYLTTTYWFKTI